MSVDIEYEFTSKYFKLAFENKTDLLFLHCHVKSLYAVFVSFIEFEIKLIFEYY